MKCFIVLAAVACVASAGVIAPATHLVRTPAFDSAVIKSDRIGGNFAYSTAENHAYAAISPVIQHVATPVAVSYSAPAFTYSAPSFHQFAYAAPGLVAPGFTAPVVAAGVPVLAAAPADETAAPAAVEAPVEAPVAAPEDAAPAESAPVAAEAAPAPAEVAPEAPASDDTVSVEAA